MTPTLDSFTLNVNNPQDKQEKHLKVTFNDMANLMKSFMTMPRNSFMATLPRSVKQKALDRKHLLPIHPTKTQRKNTWRY